MQIRIETTSRNPIYQQIMYQVREEVARGKLIPGEKLPSVRELSRTLVVNPNTIARAYTELEREGTLVTRPGLGVFVAEISQELTLETRLKRLLEKIDQLLIEAIHFGFTQEELIDLLNTRARQFQWQSAGSPSPEGDLS
jgi:GntR family transcriptional regulator